MKWRLVINFASLLCLLGLLFAFAMFQGGFTSWFLFYSLLPMLLYHFMLLVYPIKNWTVTRVLSRSTIKAGENITVQLTIQRKMPFPLYYCIVEEIFPESLMKQAIHQTSSDQPNHEKHFEKRMIFPWFKRTFHMTYELVSIPRGEHPLNAIHIRTGDVFGLIGKMHTFRTMDSITVFPRKRPVHMNEQVLGYEQGTMTSKALNSSVSSVASGSREYMPGDRMAWINWKQTAQKNKLMTKEFEQEKGANHLIVLDSSKRQNLDERAYEATIELVLSLTERFKEIMVPATLLTIADQSTYLPVQSDREHLIEHHLMTVKPAHHTHFATEVKKEAKHMYKQSSMMIVTTQVDEPLKKVVKFLNYREKRVVLLVVKAKEHLTQADERGLYRLSQQGIDVSLLTETQLVKEVFEVKLL